MLSKLLQITETEQCLKPARWRIHKAAMKTTKSMISWQEWRFSSKILFFLSIYRWTIKLEENQEKTKLRRWECFGTNPSLLLCDHCNSKVERNMFSLWFSSTTWLSSNNLEISNWSSETFEIADEKSYSYPALNIFFFKRKPSLKIKFTLFNFFNKLLHFWEKTYFTNNSLSVSESILAFD